MRSTVGAWHTYDIQENSIATLMLHNFRVFIMGPSILISSSQILLYLQLTAPCVPFIAQSQNSLMQTIKQAHIPATEPNRPCKRAKFRRCCFCCCCKCHLYVCIKCWHTNLCASKMCICIGLSVCGACIHFFLDGIHFCHIVTVLRNQRAG